MEERMKLSLDFYDNKVEKQILIIIMICDSFCFQKKKICKLNGLNEIILIDLIIGDKVINIEIR